MSQLPSIICPVDFSDHSRRALEYAARVAEHFRARLIVLNVLDPLLVSTAVVRQLDLVADTRAELHQFVEAAVQHLESRVGELQVLIRSGDPAREILRVSEDEHVDLIVMGTHGLSGYRKMFFGSTTERVLRHAAMPVLAVPLGEGEVLVPADRLASVLDPILVPVDFSETSTRAAHVAAAIASALDVRLALVHAVTPVHLLGRWREQARVQEREGVANAHERMNTLARSFPAGTRTETDARVGSAAEVIAAVATEMKARLIVLGLRGAGGMTGPGPGSVTYRVLSLAPVPVLALPFRRPITGLTAQRSSAEAGAQP